jgi:DNA-binding NarL/FixJ family response regulator
MSVLVLDSERALAEALAASLREVDDIASAASAQEPRFAAEVIRSGTVDVLVVGMDTDEWDPLGFLRWARRRVPHVALVALSADGDPDRIVGAVSAGASSWLPKQAGVHDLVAVVRSAARGESSIPGHLLGPVLRRLLTAGPAAVPASRRLAVLTEREREILEHAVLGLGRAEIAAEVGASVNTVRTHLQHIMTKLGVHSTLEAVTLVIRERAAGDLAPPPPDPGGDDDGPGGPAPRARRGSLRST